MFRMTRYKRPAEEPTDSAPAPSTPASNEPYEDLSFIITYLDRVLPNVTEIYCSNIFATFTSPYIGYELSFMYGDSGIAISKIDGDGSASVYVYGRNTGEDSLDDDQQFTMVYSKYEYKSNGQLSKIYDMLEARRREIHHSMRSESYANAVRLLTV